MKTDELMTGDVVKLRGRYAEVLAIDSLDESVRVMMTDDGTVEDAVVWDIEPIPITSEMAERNGFRQVADDAAGIWYNEYETDDRRMRLLDISPTHGEGVWYLHVDDSDMDTVGRLTVRFFHELQHAYRICSVKRGLVL